MTKIAITRCTSYEPGLVQEKVREAIDSLGGIGSFIKPDSRVLVKPNLLMAKSPEFGVDTHPEVLRAVIKILKGVNCKIFVGDGPSVWGNQAENVDQVYEISGIKKVCEEERVDLVKFDHKRMRDKFPLTTWLDNCDYLVSVPKFKTHSLTILTGAVKNLFGLVSGNFKMELHKTCFHIDDFSKMLLDIYKEAKPALTVIDGIIAMEGDGPSTAGKLRNENLILAGSDGVALDSVMAVIMGLKPQDIPTNYWAAKLGIGVTDLKDIEVLCENLEDVIGKPFLMPQTSIQNKIPVPFAKLILKLVKHYPAVDKNNCIRCSACVEACPNDVITMSANGIIFDYRKCISCFCCQEFCPASAIKVKKTLFAKLMGL